MLGGDAVHAGAAGLLRSDDGCVHDGGAGDAVPRAVGVELRVELLARVAVA